MAKRTKVLIYAAAAHMLLFMMAIVVKSRKRKRSECRPCISYGPMEERDRMRIDYLNKKIWKNDTTCINMLRLTRESFRFCQLFRDRVDRPSKARAFCSLSFSHKLNWAAKFITEHFP